MFKQSNVFCLFYFFVKNNNLGVLNFDIVFYFWSGIILFFFYNREPAKTVINRHSHDFIKKQNKSDYQLFFSSY